MLILNLLLCGVCVYISQRLMFNISFSKNAVVIAVSAFYLSKRKLNAFLLAPWCMYRFVGISVSILPHLWKVLYKEDVTRSLCKIHIIEHSNSISLQHYLFKHATITTKSIQAVKVTLRTSLRVNNDTIPSNKLISNPYIVIIPLLLILVIVLCQCLSTIMSYLRLVYHIYLFIFYL